jgi:hypothetical protein
MKKLLIMLTALAFIAGANVMKAEAALSDSITITVTFQSVSVSVTPDTWPIGVVTPSSVHTQLFTATNGGNAPEDLAIDVSNSADWACAPGFFDGNNSFKMEYSLTGSPPWLQTGCGAGFSIATDVAVGDQPFTLQFTSPSTSATIAEQTITVIISASAATP